MKQGVIPPTLHKGIAKTVNESWIRPHANQGEGNAHSKLTEVQVRLIRDIYRYDQRITMKQIGALFAVSEVTIHLIISRKSWSHVR